MNIFLLAFSLTVISLVGPRGWWRWLAENYHNIWARRRSWSWRARWASFTASPTERVSWGGRCVSQKSKGRAKYFVISLHWPQVAAQSALFWCPMIPWLPRRSSETGEGSGPVQFLQWMALWFPQWVIFQVMLVGQDELVWSLLLNS